MATGYKNPKYRNLLFPSSPPSTSPIKVKDLHSPNPNRSKRNVYLESTTFPIHNQESRYSILSIAPYLSNENNSNIISYGSDEEQISSGIGTFKKVLYDPIYKNIGLTKRMLQIIDTPVFQRLRNLKQLGCSCFIYPGATHSRFEHCIGTGHLARDLVNKCLVSKKYSLNEPENKNLIECVTLAGLCHDIGHGPFSHLFSSVINQDWEHEEFSEKLLQYLIDKNNVDLTSDELKLIVSLITGEVNNELTDESWIYQIVSNKMNSIDVDKFDYIQRDIYHIGLSTTSVNYNRIFLDCKIIDNRICFNEKNDLTLTSLFESRYNLHRKVYKHNKVLVISSMISDALKLSNEYFRFDEAINDPEKFICLDDSVIDIISNFSKNEDEKIRDNLNLIKAQGIIHDLYSRNLYKIIGEILIPSGIKYNVDVNEFLCNENPKDEYYVTEEDIHINKYVYDYGNKDKNPFENIYFYNSKNPTYSFNKLNRCSIIMPKVFREFEIKVFCKNEKKVERATKMFEIFRKKLYKEWGVKSLDSCNDNDNDRLLDGVNSGFLENEHTPVKDFLRNKRKSF